jgi:radical SAM superfamily enzyme YgiQ (UPF0313 family)
MARVLLVSANQERSPDPVAPIGLCYVASATERVGHAVSVADLCFEPDVDAALQRAISDMRPDVIGIALRNVDNCAYPDTVSYLPHYRRVVDACRSGSSAPIVLGGSAFTTMPAYYLERLDVPFGVVGEGEVAFVELLARLEQGAPVGDVAGVASRANGDGAVRVSAPSWLPALDTLRLDRRWIDLPRYYREGGMASLQTKRGCHYRCTYCAYPLIEGRGMRTRSPASIADEVRGLLDQGLEQFFVVDSIFNAPRGYAESIAEALRPIGREVRWSCFVAPGNFTRELCDLMQEAGCQSVDFGTDAGSATTLRAFRKHFNVDDVRRASAICRERGLPFCHSLIFGGEDETWETVRETVALMDECRPTAVNAMCGVRVYPGTPLAETLLARGELPSPVALHEPWFYFSPAVREGLAEHVADVADQRGNWLLPGRRVGEELDLLRMLRGRGLKGDLWRYLSRLRLGMSLAGASARD